MTGIKFQPNHKIHTIYRRFGNVTTKIKTFPIFHDFQE